MSLLSPSVTVPGIPNEATCVGCGCSDSFACSGGCAWIVVSRYFRIGVCTNCEKHFKKYLRRITSLKKKEQR